MERSACLAENTFAGSSYSGPQVCRRDRLVAELLELVPIRRPLSLSGSGALVSQIQIVDWLFYDNGFA